jgi:hypothetical protein
VRDKFAELLHVPFRLEFSGSQIVFCDQELDYSSAERERDLRPVQAFRELDLGSVPLSDAGRHDGRQ